MGKITGTTNGEKLNGTKADDEIYLLGGDDTCTADLGNDVVYGGDGDDIIWGRYSNTVGDDGNDTFYGEAGNDRLYGGTGNDKLDGGVGDDKLYGDEGNDSIDGGTGNDTINGGTGIDTAIYSKAASNYTIQIDGPGIIITDKITNEKDILSSIERLSFAGVVSDVSAVSAFGKVSVDFNTLSIPDKKVILEEHYKALITDGTKKWSGTNFTYSFAQSSINSNPSYIPSGETYIFQVLGSYLQNLIRETFDFLQALLPLSFAETTNTQSATFKFESHNMTAAGYAQYPGNSNSGIIRISTQYSSDKLGQFGVGTVVHELGHALGLDHTSSRGEKTIASGGGDDSPSIPDYLDWSSLSMMTYARVFVNEARQSSYSALDLRALFSLYGKRESNEATTFKLHYDPTLSTSSKQSSLNKIQTGQWDIYGYAPFMIVDNGGTDTVDVSNWKGGVKVDLSGWGIGPIGGAKYNYTFNSATNGFLSSDGDGYAIVTIYPDTILERVIGSPEADTIIGYTASETLDGGAGNDHITGGGGNDTINGGTGIDTVVYSGKISDYSISYNRALSTLSISDKRKLGDGIDNLKDVEKLQFSDKAFDLINPSFTSTPTYGKTPSFLFDPVYYLLKNPELVPTVNLLNAFDHYKTVGAASHKKPNNWFDPFYYSNKWADLRPLNLDAATLFIHYNLYGVWEGRSAGPTFDKYDGSRYLKENPDVATYVDAYVADFLGSRVNGAIAHYIIYGANESRIGYDLNGQVIDQVILVGTPLS